MKIVVIGGTGLIGSKVVQHLTDQGHETVPASPRLGVNTITGEGVAEAVAGASVVIDVSNSPNFEYMTALPFFERSTHNLLAAEAAANVGHHVALSVVGTRTLSQSGDPETTTAGYFRAKLTQEELIQASGIPYTVVHATQFFEFLGGIAGASTDGGTVRLPPARMQPIAADDVAAALADVAVGRPVNGIVELAGPEPLPMDELVRRFLRATNDARSVVVDTRAWYFGAALNDSSLVPGDNPRLGSTRFERWLSQFEKR